MATETQEYVARRGKRAPTHPGAVLKNTVLPALNISVTVNDGTLSSEPFNFQIQVGNSNDPPVITSQSALSTNEEQPFTLELSQLTVIDPDNSYPMGFSLLVAPGTN